MLAPDGLLIGVYVKTASMCGWEKGFEKPTSVFKVAHVVLHTPSEQLNVREGIRSCFLPESETPAPAMVWPLPLSALYWLPPFSSQSASSFLSITSASFFLYMDGFSF